MIFYCSCILRATIGENTEYRNTLLFIPGNNSIIENIRRYATKKLIAGMQRKN